jgi:hypothetical protein
METVDILWLLGYALQLIMSNLTYYLVSASLSSKPLVSQSIFDQALLDGFLVSML